MTWISIAVTVLLLSFRNLFIALLLDVIAVYYKSNTDLVYFMVPDYCNNFRELVQCIKCNSDFYMHYVHIKMYTLF